MINTLVFGGTGLIGTYLIEHYSQQRNFILCARNSPTQKNVRWIKCNLLGSIPFEAFYNNDIQEVIYLAQHPNYRNFPTEALEIFRVNTECFLEVLDFCQKNKIKNVVYASSGGIYGNSSESFIEEDWLKKSHGGWRDSANTLSFYYRTKLMAEIIAESYMESLNVSALRFFFVYGHKQKLSTFMMKLIHNIYNKIPITLEGNNGVKLNPIHALDAASSILFCLEKGMKGSFNICGKEEFFLKEVSQIIGKCLGVDPIFQVNGDIDGGYILGNFDKIKSFGWVPSISFYDAIKKMVELFLTQETMVDKSPE